VSYLHSEAGPAAEATSIALKTSIKSKSNANEVNSLETRVKSNGKKGLKRGTF